MQERITFAVIGAGWRAQSFLRLARAWPQRFEPVGVISRRPEHAAEVGGQYDVPAYKDLDDLLAAGRRPSFVVTAVPPEANATVVREAVDAGLAVLSETAPAKGDDQRRELLQYVAAHDGRVQVAEQYHLQPWLAARLAWVQSGRIGPVSEAQVSIAHDYHGISVMRAFLGLGVRAGLPSSSAKLRGLKFNSSMIEPPGRGGPPEEEKIGPTGKDLVTLEFGDQLGVIDFSFSQYFSPIRKPRLLVRGERGELSGGRGIYMKDHLTPIEVEFIRHEAGTDANLEGCYLKGIQGGERWWYHNPLAPARLSDDEIAMGSCLLKMADYLAGGEPFYPLVDACYDAWLGECCGQAVRMDEPLLATPPQWLVEAA